MKKKLFLIIVTAALMGALILGGCAQAPAPPAAPTGPIKIGSIYDYTGTFAGIGQTLEPGLTLALANAGWAVAGRPIELIKEDSESSADAAMTKAKKLIEVDKVDAIFLPMKVEAADAVAAYCQEKGVICFTPLTVHVATAAKYDTIIGVSGAMEGQQAGLGTYAAKKLGYKTATFLCPDFQFGYDVAHSVEFGFKGAGGTVLKEIFYPMGSKDFAPFLTTIGEPDCLSVFLTGPADAAPFWTQFHDFGVKVQVIYPEIDGIEYVLQEIGDPIVGVIGCMPYTWLIDNATNKAFVEAFGKANNGYKPVAMSEAAYTSGLVYLEALKTTGGDATTSKVIDAIKGRTFDSPHGSFKIGDDRIGKPTYYIVKVVKTADGMLELQPIDSWLMTWAGE